ncbi:uncharacterized protein LOC117781617 [Drosophila innubila]|uniref:uncharacterized protein LOC117781617 n=1 Tax=Drosophila innubila TaxID=198719 RepID=UPI00148B738E|nr:uncharacterized protein LOC117781617 [Drosophila innubila]
MNCGGCCTLRRQAIIFSILTICHGAALMIIFGSISCVNWNIKALRRQRLHNFALVGLSLIHTVSGILMLIGVLKNLKFIYIPGLLISFIMPIVEVKSVLVYMIIIQLIFAVITCRFICFTRDSNV